MTRNKHGVPVFAVSQSGILLYAPEVPQFDELLVRADRNGRTEPILNERRPGGRVRLSPDGRRIALSTIRNEYEIQVYDPKRGLFNRLTTYPGWDGFPVWSPTGDRIAFSSSRSGPFNLFCQASDESGTAEELLPPAYPRWPTSWSPDGSALAYYEQKPETGYDLAVVEFGPKGTTSKTLLQTRFNERWAAFSPNGEWLAYESDISGRLYAGPLGWAVNEGVLKKAGKPMPQTWDDLTKSDYKGMIAISNPTTAGTAYTALVTLLLLKGEEKGWDYLAKLHKNIAQYTKWAPRRGNWPGGARWPSASCSFTTR